MLSRCLIFVAVAAVVVMLSGSVLGRGVAVVPDVEPVSVKPTIEGLPAELGLVLQGPLADLYVAASRLESVGLRATSAAVGVGSKRVRDAITLGVLRLDAVGRVQIDAVIEGSGPSLLELTRLGVGVERVHPELGRAQYLVPLGSLGSLALLDGVVVVRPPEYPVTQTGSLTSEGDAALRSDLARDLGVSGAGIRIGVISDGVDGLPESIASGDAPALVANEDFGRGGAEGLAMIEIIHDVAPNAEISFSGPITSLEFNETVDWLSERNDIVVDDLAWFFPGDQQSVVSVNTAAALNNPDYDIRAYFTSVGNFGDRHYQGMFSGGPDAQAEFGLSETGEVHVFRAGNGTTDVRNRVELPYNEIFVDTGQGFEILMFWDDPWWNSLNDYDLYLLDSTNTVVASSTAEQSEMSFSPPAETLFYVNEGPPGLFRLVVQNWQDIAEPRTFELFEVGRHVAPEGEEVFNFNTRAGAILGQSDSGGGVISLGAISSLDPGLDELEFFSSEGPTNNGALKPELVAYDDVSVTGNGGFPSPFLGTSAAGPHAAAMTALLLEARPYLLAADGGDPAYERALVRQILFDSAIDVLEPGLDNASGYGRIDALAALSQSPVGAVTLETLAEGPGGGPIAVTGTVTDLAGNPFPGVTVRLSGGLSDGVTLTVTGVSTEELEGVTDAVGEVTVEFTNPGPGTFAVTAVAVVAFIGEEEEGGMGTLSVTVADPVQALSLVDGGQFVFWNVGDGFVAAEVFLSVKIAWLFDAVTLSWTSYVPALGVTNFVLTDRAVLWVVSDGAQVITLSSSGVSGGL